MTAHVLTMAGVAPSRGGSHVVRALAARPCQIAVYDYDMGTDNYTVGGNDISDIWDDFKEIYYIGIEQKDTSTAADRRKFAIDYSAQTLVQYDAVNTEETATNQTVVALRLLVVGAR